MLFRSRTVACIKAIADTHIIVEDYEQANKLYELAATTALESQDTIDDVSDYLLLASLSAFATQVVYTTSLCLSCTNSCPERGSGSRKG